MASCSSSGEVTEGEVRTDGWNPFVAIVGSDSQIAMVATNSPLGKDRLVLVGDQVTSVESVDGYVLSAGWVPTTGFLVVTYSPELTSESADRVALVNPESGTANGITIDEAVASTWSRITVSQDGRFAYYSAQTPSALQLAHDIWRIDLETGSMENVTRSELGESLPILLSDDQLALIEYTPLSIEQSENGRIMVLDLESGERQRLTPEGQTVTFLDTTDTGDWIVYSAHPENRREERAIWFVPSDGSLPPQLLLEDGGFDAQLSGDDRHILVRRVGGPNDPTLLEWIEVPDTAPWID